jgi:uncharacterized pyridoxamine 5'-phosphate oxidase family protein
MFTNETIFLITINTKSAFKDLKKFFFIKNNKLSKTGKPLKNISTSPEISIVNLLILTFE